MEVEEVIPPPSPLPSPLLLPPLCARLPPSLPVSLSRPPSTDADSDKLGCFLKIAPPVNVKETNILTPAASPCWPAILTLTPLFICSAIFKPKHFSLLLFLLFSTLTRFFSFLLLFGNFRGNLLFQTYFLLQETSVAMIEKASGGNCSFAFVSVCQSPVHSPSAQIHTAVRLTADSVHPVRRLFN